MMMTRHVDDNEEKLNEDALRRPSLLKNMFRNQQCSGLPSKYRR